MSQPNLKNTIKCVSLAIYYHIKNRKASTVIDIFDENLHPLTVNISLLGTRTLCPPNLLKTQSAYVDRIQHYYFVCFRETGFHQIMTNIIQNIGKSINLSEPYLMLPSSQQNVPLLH